MKVWQNQGQFIASCPELDIFTYGSDQNQARRRLQQVLVFYAETATEMGYKIVPGELLYHFKTIQHLMFPCLATQLTDFLHCLNKLTA